MKKTVIIDGQGGRIGAKLIAVLREWTDTADRDCAQTAKLIADN